MNKNSSNVAVLSGQELGQIRALCSNQQSTQKQLANSMQSIDKEQQKLNSHTRIAKWGLTAEGIRQKKEKDKYEKFAAEEEKRRQIDMEEAAIQAQKRAQAIERANKMIYDQSDQVKSLHSAMHYSDVMQEIELLKDLKSKKKNFNQEIERRWWELQKQQCQDYDQAEILRKKLEAEKKEKSQKVLQDQLKQAKLLKVKEIKENYLEGLIIKKQAQQAAQEEVQEKIAVRNKVLSAQEETYKANQHLQRIREAERIKEKQEEEKIEAYAKQKEKVMELRKQRAEEKFQAKLAARQKIIDARIAELSALKNREEEILTKQIFEAEEKRNAELAAQEARRQELQRQIEESRRLQQERKMQEKQQEVQEGQQFKEFWKIRMEELAAEDRREKQEIAERNKNLQQFLRKQMDAKTLKYELKAKEQADEEAKALERLIKEQEQFNSYAEQAIKEWGTAGKNITPMILELKNYRKKLIE